MIIYCDNSFYRIENQAYRDGCSNNKMSWITFPKRPGRQQNFVGFLTAGEILERAQPRLKREQKIFLRDTLRIRCFELHWSLQLVAGDRNKIVDKYCMVSQSVQTFSTFVRFSSSSCFCCHSCWRNFEPHCRLNRWILD